jgi:hypothetical protein
MLFSLSSCVKPIEEKFFFVGFKMNLESAIQNPDYACSNIISVSEINTDGIQLAIPRKGNDVAYYSSINNGWFGLIVYVVGRRSNGSTEILRSEDHTGLVQPLYGKYSWGIRWENRNKRVKVDRMKTSEFLEIKIQVTYVTPCRSCWTPQLGANSREIWKGESDWIKNTSDIKSETVELFYKEARKQNDQGIKACN